MNILQAALLGLVQGLTEFLPISSSAHLVIVQHLLGFKEPLLFFDIILHWGTLVSLFVYFAGDLAHLMRDSIYGLFFLFQRKSWKQIDDSAPYFRFAILILIASVPTALMGILLKDWFESLFGSLRDVGRDLLITSALLIGTYFFQKGVKTVRQMSVLDAVFLGILQGVSIIPGISRSGAAISAALFRGLDRETAFRFAFLMGVPAILGAGLVEFRDIEYFRQYSLPVLTAGFIVSAIFGYLSLIVLAALVKQGKLYQFAFYTLPLGLLILKFAHLFE